MSITVNELTFAYERTPVLQGIGVEAANGRITALIGPNAAGKSTLLRCLIGALRPQTGTVRINGREAHRLNGSQLARTVAYVPQRSEIAAAFSVREIVDLGRYALSRDPARVEAALDELELADLADRPYQNLSVGQQQRVTLARAIAQLEPRGHLILDEPTSAMDLRHVSRCLRLLRRIAEEGSAVVLALHDLTSAALLADDIWILDGGRLEAAGPVSQVMRVDRLQDVFGVPFVWIEAAGMRLLHADVWTREGITG